MNTVKVSASRPQAVPVDRWPWAVKKDAMNRNTAGRLRAGCVQVVGILDDPDETYIEGVDIDDISPCSQDHHKQRIEPHASERSKCRLRSAVKSYKDYLATPGARKPATHHCSGSSVGRPQTSEAALSGRTQRPHRARTPHPYNQTTCNSRRCQIDNAITA